MRNHNHKKPFLFILVFFVMGFFRPVVSMQSNFDEQQLERRDTESVDEYLARLNVICSVLYLQKQFIPRVQEAVSLMRAWIPKFEEVRNFLPLNERVDEGRLKMGMNRLLDLAQTHEEVVDCLRVCCDERKKERFDEIIADGARKITPRKFVTRYLRSKNVFLQKMGRFLVLRNEELRSGKLMRDFKREVRTKDKDFLQKVLGNSSIEKQLDRCGLDLVRDTAKWTKSICDNFIFYNREEREKICQLTWAGPEHVIEPLQQVEQLIEQLLAVESQLNSLYECAYKKLKQVVTEQRKKHGRDLRRSYLSVLPLSIREALFQDEVQFSFVKAKQCFQSTEDDLVVSLSCLRPLFVKTGILKQNEKVGLEQVKIFKKVLRKKLQLYEEIRWLPSKLKTITLDEVEPVKPKPKAKKTPKKKGKKKKKSKKKKGKRKSKRKWQPKKKQQKREVVTEEIVEEEIKIVEPEQPEQQVEVVHEQEIEQEAEVELEKDLVEIVERASDGSFISQDRETCIEIANPGDNTIIRLYKVNDRKLEPFVFTEHTHVSRWFGSHTAIDNIMQNEYDLSTYSFVLYDDVGAEHVVNSRQTVEKLFRIHHAFALMVDRSIFTLGIQTQWRNIGTGSVDINISIPGEIQYDDGRIEYGVFTYAFSKNGDNWICYHRCFSHMFKRRLLEEKFELGYWKVHPGGDSYQFI